MDFKTQKTLWEFESLGMLWGILDAGLVLNGAYSDTGIINECKEGVVIDVTAIVEQSNEQIESRQVGWFEGAANMVNKYMDDPSSYQIGAVNPLVKLIGDKLLQTFAGKRVEIDF